MIFAAKKEFEAYLVSSADFSSIIIIGLPDLTYGLYSFSISFVARSLLDPTTIRSGFKKSSTANPSLKNSGFETTSNSTFACFAIAAFTLSEVPTGTVLLSTITL